VAWGLSSRAGAPFYTGQLQGEGRGGFNASGWRAPSLPAVTEEKKRGHRHLMDGKWRV
jgi:hypothetical protein